MRKLGKLSLAVACVSLLASPATAVDARSGEGAACDPRGELVSLLPGVDVEGFLFALSEEGDQTVSSLTNGAVRELTTLGKEDTGLVLRYTGVKDPRTEATRLYKSEVIRNGDALTLVVTDLETSSADSLPFPTPGIACEPPGLFDTLDACLKEFDCTRRGGFQCEANRTCKPQIAALTCCLKDGTGISVHLIIRPTSIRCALRDLVPDVEGLVLSPN